MDANKHVPLAIATLAIVATLIGSTRVIEHALEKAAAASYETQFDDVERVLGSIDARLKSIDENLLLVEQHGESPAQAHQRLDKQRQDSTKH